MLVFDRDHLSLWRKWMFGHKLSGLIPNVGFKLDTVGKGDTNRVAAGKPRVGITLPGRFNASGNTYNGLRSTEVSEAYLKCTDTGSMRNKQDEL